MGSSNLHKHPALDVHNLTVFYGNKPALWEVDFSLPQGAHVGILGPNGSGKSTLLKSIMGLVKPASGKISIFGENLSAVRQKISYVPQKESVDWDFPVTVKDVVRMGRYKPGKIFGRLSKLDKDLADNAMAKLNISDLANRHISELSGGQQQRVFIARSIAQDADLYFMDEPFTGVDAATEEIIIALVKELCADKKTVIMVHHDLNSAPNYFDHIVMLNTRLIANGKTEEVFNQENIKSAFGAQLNILTEVSNKVVKTNYPVREMGQEQQ